MVSNAAVIELMNYSSLKTFAVVQCDTLFFTVCFLLQEVFFVQLYNLSETKSEHTSFVENCETIQRIMEWVHDLTKFFLEDVLSPKSITLLSSKADLSSWTAIQDSISKNTSVWLDYYSIYVVFISIGILSFLLVPLLMLLIGCCRLRKNTCRVDVPSYPLDDRGTVRKHNCCCCFILSLSVVFIVLTSYSLALSVGILKLSTPQNDNIAIDLSTNFNAMSSFLDDVTDGYAGPDLEQG